MRRRTGLKIIGILVFMLLNIEGLMGQRWKLLRYQVGAGFGTTQIFGDIGGTADANNWFGIKDISFSETKMSYKVNVRYKVNTLWSANVNIHMGSGKGTDVNSRNDRGRSYSARFYEFSGQAEYYFLSEEPRYRSAAMFNKKGMINNYSTLSAYAFIGAGMTYSSLKHDQGLLIPDIDAYKASNIAPVVSLGIGAKYVIDERWFVGAEFGYRYALNDYIEGYKQTRDSKFNDVYYFLMFSANYRLKTSRRGLPAFLDRRQGRFGY